MPAIPDPAFDQFARFIGTIDLIVYAVATQKFTNKLEWEGLPAGSGPFDFSYSINIGRWLLDETKEAGTVTSGNITQDARVKTHLRTLLRVKDGFLDARAALFRSPQKPADWTKYYGKLSEQSGPFAGAIADLAAFSDEFKHMDDHFKKAVLYWKGMFHPSQPLGPDGDPVGSWDPGTFGSGSSSAGSGSGSGSS